MADRYFPNEFPEFVPETPPHTESAAAAAPHVSDSLTKLLHLPYKTLSELLKKDALDIKNTVVKETWIAKGKRVGDYTLYTGALGTAFLLFKSYQVTGDKSDLLLCSEIISSCDAASHGSGRVTFICGQAGVYALGAAVAKHRGEQQLLQQYLGKFREIKITKDIPDELLYGRAGFLWACSFLNKNIGQGTIPSTTMREVTNSMIESGRKLGRGRCPLMYEWHGKKYWGAAHGLAGIIHVLLDMDLKPDEAEDVKNTLCYMMKNRFPSGNYPSSEGSETDRLVHWCHGAPGVALALAKAAKVFGSEEFTKAAIEAGEVVWTRGLLKRVGICHGICGNAYVFLTLYQLTGNAEYLYRAKAFASFLRDRARVLTSNGAMHGGDRPYSLFEGLGGMAHLFLDMAEPTKAKFPAYQL